MRVGAPRHPALRGVVRFVWAGEARPVAWTRERIVPTGQMHLAWRTGPTAIRLGWDGAQVERCGVVGGPRVVAHVHDTSPGARSVGVALLPGAGSRVLGVPARALAGMHVGLEALWGREARWLQEQLEAADDAEAVALVEAALVARLRPGATPPGLGRALVALEEGVAVAEVAKRLGRSARTLGGWMDDAVGLSPAAWTRVRRLQRALTLAADEPDGAALAQAAGYYDQAHLCREIKAIVGVTLGDWRGHPSGEPNHVPVWEAGPGAPTGKSPVAALPIRVASLRCGVSTGIEPVFAPAPGDACVSLRSSVRLSGRRSSGCGGAGWPG